VEVKAGAVGAVSKVGATKNEDKWYKIFSKSTLNPDLGRHWKITTSLLSWSERWQQ
jgi:hypothetical protein